MLRDLPYRDTVKAYRWVVGRYYLSGESYLHCLLGWVRIKGHFPFECPKIDQLQVMIYVISGSTRIVNDRKDRRIISEEFDIAV